MEKKDVFKNSAYAISDQIFGTGAHFLLHILVARYYTVEVYGEFVFLYTFFIMVRMVHNALVQEPVSVLQLGDLRKDNNSLSSIYIYSHFLFFPTFVLISITYFFFETLSLTEIFFFMTACLIEMFYWGGRSIVFKNERPFIASVASFVYLLSILILFTSFKIIYEIDISPFLILTISSILSGGLLFYYIKPPVTTSYVEVKEITKKCYQYGKWAIPAAMLIWVVNNIYFVLLPAFHGIESSGYLKALLNILIPFNHLITGASLFLLPMFSRLYRNEEIKKYNSNLILISLLVFFGALAFGIFVKAFSYEILYFVYGEEYTLYSEALGYAALCLPLLWGLTAIIRVGLRAKNLPNKVFFTYALSLFPIGFIIIYFGILYNITGSLISMVALQIIILSIIYYLYKYD